jgi:hypothetical protein
MKMRSLKAIGLAVLLGTLGLVCVTAINAQQNKAAQPTAARWIGYVVAGKPETTDQIARGTYPTRGNRSSQ